ncbi:MAG TPA: hypothetical protein VMR62_22030 [Bryobacteraceae bacterium]|nr:hypothetical protein [Bryobacteraceae bacterium]
MNPPSPTSRDPLSGEAIECAAFMIGWDAPAWALALVAIEISAGRGDRLAGFMAQAAGLRRR